MMNSIVLSFTDLQMSDVSNPATHLQQQNTVLFARKRVTLIYVFVKNYLTKKNYLKTQTCLDKQISLPLRFCCLLGIIKTVYVYFYSYFLNSKSRLKIHVTVTYHMD